MAVLVIMGVPVARVVVALVVNERVLMGQITRGQVVVRLAPEIMPLLALAV